MAVRVTQNAVIWKSQWSFVLEQEATVRSRERGLWNTKSILVDVKSFECLRSAAITAASYAVRLEFEYGAALKRPAILIDFFRSFSQSPLTDTLTRNRSTFFLVYYG